MAISKAFKNEALGIPDLSEGGWMIQDVAGHGLMQSIEAAAAPKPEEPSATVKPQKFEV